MESITGLLLAIAAFLAALAQLITALKPSKKKSKRKK